MRGVLVFALDFDRRYIVEMKVQRIQANNYAHYCKTKHRHFDDAAGRFSFQGVLFFKSGHKSKQELRRSCDASDQGWHCEIKNQQLRSIAAFASALRVKLSKLVRCCLIKFGVWG